MSRVPHKLIGAAALLALCACDSGAVSGSPGAVSEGEAQALDEAAEMLEERSLPEGVLPPLEAPQQAPGQDAPQEEATE